MSANARSELLRQTIPTGVPSSVGQDQAMNQAIQEHAVVGVFASHLDAEAAIKALQSGGIDMKKLSIVGKNTHTEEHAVGFYTAGDRMMCWGGQGAFWGSLLAAQPV